MPTVAIAGGTSPSLGRSLTTAILTLNPKWNIVILTRHSSSKSSAPTPSTWLTPLLTAFQSRLTLLPVAYTDHAAITAALHSVHTVISVIGFSVSDTAQHDEWFATQLALLRAATAAGVKRFAPSEFGVGVDASAEIEVLAGNIDVWKACAESGLEWTRYECGLFMNYLGFGVEKGDKRKEALGGREADGEWFYYTTVCKAELPLKADGSFPQITMTAMEDIGKFVARSLEVPLGEWEATSYMVGETLRMDELVRVAERVMGRKWEVETLTLEALEARIEELEAAKNIGGKMWAQLALCYAKDAEGQGWLDGRLNKLFPEVKPLSVEDYLLKYYG